MLYFKAAYGLDHKLFGLHVPPESPLVDRAVAQIQAGGAFDIQLIAFQKRHHDRTIFLQSAPGVPFEANDGIVEMGNPDQVEGFSEAYGLDRISLYGHTYRKSFFQAVGIAEIILDPE